MSTDKKIYITSFETPIGMMWIGSGKNGVIKISLGNIAQRDFFSYVKKHYTDDMVVTDKEYNAGVLQELNEYFRGERRNFSLKTDISTATEFQKKVWMKVCEIPYGETTTYGQIAKRIANPRATRAVGGANNRNNIPIIIPCHRVIGRDGELVGYGGGLFIKRVLLEHEAKMSGK